LAQVVRAQAEIWLLIAAFLRCLCFGALLAMSCLGPVLAMSPVTAPPHVVFMNMAATGHMNPTLPLVAQLRARGCKVSYFVEDTMRGVVEAAGAVWHPFRYASSGHTGIVRYLDEHGIEKYVPSGTPKEEYLHIAGGLVYNAEILLPTLLEDLEAIGPAVIVYEPFLAFPQVAAHVLGIPAVSLLTMPGPGVLKKPDELCDKWMSYPWVQGPRKAILDKYDYDVLKNGMPMEFYSTTLNLVTTISELYLPPALGRQQEKFGNCPFQCIGVMADPKLKRIANANIKEGSVQELAMADLEEACFLGRQVIYVSMGTVATDDRTWNEPFGVFGADNGLEHCTGKQFMQHVLRSCFEALDGDDKVLVIVSLGPQADVLDGLPAAPENFVLRQAVPQLEVLLHCSAFVTHCGANSMHEALSLGVPMVVAPIFGDQPLNGDSVAASGAGLCFRNPLDTLSATSLRSALQQLLDPSETNSFRASAKKMSERLAAAGSVKSAAEAVLAQVGRGKASAGGA